MRTARLEAFSDAVIAIAMTIMVLDLKPPHGAHWSDLGKVFPGLLTYLLSFVTLGIYWNNHHHMMHATERVNGRILWANMHLLFWLSLLPFGTAWVKASSFAKLSTAVYGIVLLAAAVAYLILQLSILALEGSDSTLARAVGKDVKGKISAALYAAAIGLSFVSPWVAIGIYALVALIWLVPDPRIETVLGS